jgi:hypothetical protein
VDRLDRRIFRVGLVDTLDIGKYFCIVPVFVVDTRIFRFDLVDRLGKAIQLQAWIGPWGSRRLRLTEFLDIQHMDMVRL